MGAEQKISASVYTHRGNGYGANTSSYILDGRYPKGFESDNSSVSIANTDRAFFFAVCDTKQTDDLNESVSGIKELRKICAQFKSSPRDIRTKTEALGECFVETENLLYDTAVYLDDGSGDRRRPMSTRVDKNDEDDADEREDVADGEDGEENDNPSGAARSRDRSKTSDADESENADDETDEYDDKDEAELTEPGAKGFSSVGFIINETKGSILAQGECTALLLRDNALRIVSGGAKRGARAEGSPSGYGGRASAVFELRDGDVFLLCTMSILNAIGEESVDGYLGLDDETSNICYEIINDAIEADPTSNMTCLVVRIEERIDEEDDETYLSPQQHSAAQRDMRSGAYGAGMTGGDALGGAGAAAAGAAQGQQTQAYQQNPYQNQGSYQNAYQQQGQPFQYQQQGQQNPYQQRGTAAYGSEMDSRMQQQGAAQPFNRAPSPYGGGSGAFPSRPTTKFAPPPRTLAAGANSRNLIISVSLTVGLVLVLVIALFLFTKNQDDNKSTDSSTTSPTSASVDSEGVTTTEPDDDSGNVGDIYSTTEPTSGAPVDDMTTPVYTTTTTTATTTQPPERIHKVKANETLSSIAQQYYNASRYYTLIKEANNLESDLILEGQNLIIPEKPEETTTAGDGGEGGAEGAGEPTTTRTTAPRISTQ